MWDNIENINHYGRNLEDDDPAYLSMLNQSIRANNLDFSVDISRVVSGAVKEQVNVNNILKEVEEKEDSWSQVSHKIVLICLNIWSNGLIDLFIIDKSEERKNRKGA